MPACDAHDLDAPRLPLLTQTPFQGSEELTISPLSLVGFFQIETERSHMFAIISTDRSAHSFFFQIKQMQCWSFLDINKRGLMWEGKFPAQPHGSLYAFVTRQLPSTKSVWCVWLCDWLCQCESIAGKHCVVVILYPASCVLVRQHKNVYFDCQVLKKKQPTALFENLNKQKQET